MASTVAESSPPESNTTAGFTPRASLARYIAPQHLVELQLEAHRQTVGQDPIGERGRRYLRVARREQHLAPLAQGMLLEICLAPVVVLARADHELHLVARGEQSEVPLEISRRLARPRSLHIDHAGNPGVDAGNARCTARLERYPIPRFAQAAQQLYAVRLGQRLSAG